MVLIWLHCCTRSVRTIFKGKGLKLDWLLFLFSILKIDVKMFVNHLEIGDGSGDSGLECTLMSICGSLTFSSHSFLFTFGFGFSFEHFLDAFRNIILAVLIDDFLKNSFSSFILFLLDSFQKINFAVPGQRLCDESVLLFSVFVNRFGFRLWE